jgi:hypothetical protein
MVGDTRDAVGFYSHQARFGIPRNYAPDTVYVWIHMIEPDKESLHRIFHLRTVQPVC